MSKAFTREDDLPDPRALRRVSSPLPPGAKNYLTPDGAGRLREELENLSGMKRSPAKETSKNELEWRDQRIQQLRQSLETAVVVPPPGESETRVKFGATVTVREPDGKQAQYRIVGVDETDVDRGWVSWLSPIARVLLNSGIGDRVRLKIPSGEMELEILEIRYS